MELDSSSLCGEGGVILVASIPARVFPNETTIDHVPSTRVRGEPRPDFLRTLGELGVGP
jgi:hypothetical protein